MAKLEELTYDVRESLKDFSDDSEIDDRYIIYLYNIKRAKYLRQDLNIYTRTRDNSILQTFCIGLEEVLASECSMEYDCGTILRTKVVIPTPLELHTKVAITRVKPTNRTSIPFNFITKDKMAFVEGATFKNSIYAFLDTDGYIYVTSSGGDDYKLLECLTITGIFENPLDLANYQTCCDCTGVSTVCFNEMISEYPLQPHYIDLIRKEIVSELQATKTLEEDKENNDTDL